MTKHDLSGRGFVPGHVARILDEKDQDTRARIAAMLTPAQAPEPHDPHCTCPDCLADHAPEVLTPAERQAQHLSTFGPAGPHQSIRQAHDQDQARADYVEVTLRVLAVHLEELIARYGAGMLLEAFADVASQRTADGGSEPGTGSWGALALALEEAREYALRQGL